MHTYIKMSNGTHVFTSNNVAVAIAVCALLGEYECDRLIYVYIMKNGYYLLLEAVGYEHLSFHVVYSTSTVIRSQLSLSRVHLFLKSMKYIE
jgi:hypothetical protein